MFGSFDKSGGYKAFRDQDYQPSSTHRNRTYQVYTAGGKYAWDVTSQLRLEAAYTHTGADLDFAQPYRVASNVNARQEDLASVKIDYQATDRLGFFVKSYYHNWDNPLRHHLQRPGQPRHDRRPLRQRLLGLLGLRGETRSASSTWPRACRPISATISKATADATRCW
ncbi:MAG: hypothetical protein WDN45_18785 [Caulobacteraceae bacterium]